MVEIQLWPDDRYNDCLEVKKGERHIGIVEKFSFDTQEGIWWICVSREDPHTFHKINVNIEMLEQTNHRIGLNSFVFSAWVSSPDIERL